MTVFKTYRAASVAGTFDDIVEALRALASDPESDPKEAEKAQAALKAMKDDQSKSAAKRNAAYRAHKQVEETVAMRRRMGVPAKADARSPVKHDGRTTTFGVMTAAQARALGKH